MLSDAALDDGDGKPAVKVSVKAEPLDLKHAMGELLKAIEAKDVNSMADAYRLADAACDSEQGEDDGEDGEEE